MDSFNFGPWPSRVGLSVVVAQIDLTCLLHAIFFIATTHSQFLSCALALQFLSINGNASPLNVHSHSVSGLSCCCRVDSALCSALFLASDDGVTISVHSYSLIMAG